MVAVSLKDVPWFVGVSIQMMHCDIQRTTAMEVLFRFISSKYIKMFMHPLSFTKLSRLWIDVIWKQHSDTTNEELLILLKAPPSDINICFHKWLRWFQVLQLLPYHTPQVVYGRQRNTFDKWKHTRYHKLNNDAFLLMIYFPAFGIIRLQFD